MTVVRSALQRGAGPGRPVRRARPWARAVDWLVPRPMFIGMTNIVIYTGFDDFAVQIGILLRG